MFAFDTETAAAGGDDVDIGRVSEDGGDEIPGAVQYVFAVVEDEQRSAGAQELDDALGVGVLGVSLDVERRADGRCDRVDGAHIGQLTQPHTVGIALCGSCGGVEGEAGLADPARAGQGHQPTCIEPGRDLGQFHLAADQRVAG